MKLNIFCFLNENPFFFGCWVKTKIKKKCFNISKYAWGLVQKHQKRQWKRHTTKACVHILTKKKFFLLSTELLLCNKKSIMKGFVSCRIKMRLIFYKNDSCWLEQSLGRGHAKFQVWRINKIRSPLSRNLRPCLLLNW